MVKAFFHKRDTLKLKSEKGKKSLIRLTIAFVFRYSVTQTNQPRIILLIYDSDKKVSRNYS